MFTAWHKHCSTSGSGVTRRQHSLHVHLHVFCVCCFRLKTMLIVKTLPSTSLRNAYHLYLPTTYKHSPFNVALTLSRFVRPFVVRMVWQHIEFLSSISPIQDATENNESCTLCIVKFVFVTLCTDHRLAMCFVPRGA